MTLKADMLRALEDEEDDQLKDVTLIGADGGRVSASKAVLAIRSPVFKRMFFGNWQERNSDEVKMDNYPSVVLQVVVKYCYVDELDLDLIYSDGSATSASANNKRAATTNAQGSSDDDEEEEVDRLTDAEAVALVQVRDAANYLELFELHKTISNELGESILSSGEQGVENLKKDLACVCAVMQELMARGGSDGALFLTCLDLVEAHPEACLLPAFSVRHNQGVLACSLPLLEKLLQSPAVDAFVAVKALQKWNKEHNTAEEEQQENAEELQQLQKIAESVNLDQLSAAQLAEIPPCTLFPMERLYKAFVSLSKSRGPSSPAPSPVFQSNFIFGPQGGTTTNTGPTTAPSNFLIVRGAGVDCVNGLYSILGLTGSYTYQRRGKYGDIPGKFLLERGLTGGAWKIVFESDSASSEQPKKFSFYESDSTIIHNNRDIPPFALWRCLDGKDPTPYVSVLIKQSMFASYHRNTRSSSSSNNDSRTNNNPLPDAPASIQNQMADAFRAHMAVANRNNHNNNDDGAAAIRHVRRRNVRGRRPRDN